MHGKKRMIRAPSAIRSGPGRIARGSDDTDPPRYDRSRRQQQHGARGAPRKIMCDRPTGILRQWCWCGPRVDYLSRLRARRGGNVAGAGGGGLPPPLPLPLPARAGIVHRSASASRRCPGDLFLFSFSIGASPLRAAALFAARMAHAATARIDGWMDAPRK